MQGKFIKKFSLYIFNIERFTLYGESVWVDLRRRSLDLNNFQKKWGIHNGFFQGKRKERNAREAFYFLSLLKENEIGSLIVTEGSDMDSYNSMAASNVIAFRCGVRKAFVVDRATAKRKDGKRLVHVVDMYKFSKVIPIKAIERTEIVGTLRSEERGFSYTPEEEWPESWQSLCKGSLSKPIETSRPVETENSTEIEPTTPIPERNGGLIEKGFIPAMFNGHTLSLVETIKSLHKHGLMTDTMKKEINEKIAEEMLSVDFVSVILNMKGVEA